MFPALSEISRRRVLQAGTFGALGASLTDLVASDESNRREQLTPGADSCVLIFLNGGPSHLDMWDMKPDAADGIRGEFSPIATSLPGYQMSEHLPKLAQQAHRATVVRSMHHGVNNAHAAAVYAAITGHDRGEIGGGTKPTDYPTPGSVLSMIRPPERNAVSHVCLPYTSFRPSMSLCRTGSSPVHFPFRRSSSTLSIAPPGYFFGNSANR